MPIRGVTFRIYLAAEDKVIETVLTQKTEGKEHVITYICRQLSDAETRYIFIESCVCLSFMLVSN